MFSNDLRTYLQEMSSFHPFLSIYPGRNLMLWLRNPATFIQVAVISVRAAFSKQRKQDEVSAERHLV